MVHAWNYARSSISLRTVPSPIVSNSWKRDRRLSRRRRFARSPPARRLPKTSRRWRLQNPARSSARPAPIHTIHLALLISTHCASNGSRRSLSCPSAHCGRCHPSRISCGARQRKPQTALQFRAALADGRWANDPERAIADIRALGLFRRMDDSGLPRPVLIADLLPLVTQREGEDDGDRAQENYRAEQQRDEREGVHSRFLSRSLPHSRTPHRGDAAVQAIDVRQPAIGVAGGLGKESRAWAAQFLGATQPQHTLVRAHLDELDLAPGQ